jgi:hypothetical protein
MLGTAPPRPAARRAELATQERSASQFKRPLWKDAALRSISNVVRRPGVFSHHLLQPQLIGGIQGNLAVKASCH